MLVTPHGVTGTSSEKVPDYVAGRRLFLASWPTASRIIPRPDSKSAPD